MKNKVVEEFECINIQSSGEYETRRIESLLYLDSVVSSEDWKPSKDGKPSKDSLSSSEANEIINEAWNKQIID